MATKNYVLGRGKLYFDQYAAGTQNLTGERYIGSTPSFGISIESSTLDHMSMEEGVKVNDRSVLLDITRSGTFTTDNVDPKNLSLFLLGDADALTVAGGAITGYTINSVSQDRYYQLGASSTNITGARNVSLVTVQDDTPTTPVTFTVNVDYTVDAELGRLYIVEGGAIVDGTNLVIGYTEAAYTRSQVITSDNIKIEGALRFISFNADGEQGDFFMPYVQISPSGELTLKSDEWQTLPFNLKVMSKDATTSAIYRDGRPYTV